MLTLGAVVPFIGYLCSSSPCSLSRFYNKLKKVFTTLLFSSSLLFLWQCVEGKSTGLATACSLVSTPWCSTKGYNRTLYHEYSAHVVLTLWLDDELGLANHFDHGHFGLLFSFLSLFTVICLIQVVCKSHLQIAILGPLLCDLGTSSGHPHCTGWRRVLALQTCAAWNVFCLMEDSPDLSACQQCTTKIPKTEHLRQ